MASSGRRSGPTMCDILANEFRVSNLGFAHDNVAAHVKSQWQWHPGIYITYRIFTALWCIGCFIYLATMDCCEQHSIMAFLTTWTYLALTLYLVLAAIVTIAHATCRQTEQHVNNNNNNDSEQQKPDNKGITNMSFDDVEKNGVTFVANGNSPCTRDQTSFQTLQTSDDKLTWYMKLMWCIADIVYVFAIIVTCVYFIALFPLMGKTNFLDINLHGVNTFFVVVDVCLVARPVRLLHVIYPTIYGVCYVIFSALYWNADKEENVLYPGVLDWNDPGHTLIVVCSLTFIGLPALQMLHFGIYRLRLYISNKDQ